MKEKEAQNADVTVEGVLLLVALAITVTSGLLFIIHKAST